MRKHLTYKSFFLAVLLAVLSHPGMLSGQQAAADTSIAWIPAFASAFIELEPLRIEQETLLARPENKSVQAQEDVRSDFRERRAQLLRSHNLTEDDFSDLLFLVSTSDVRNKAFRDAVELAGK